MNTRKNGSAFIGPALVRNFLSGSGRYLIVAGLYFWITPLMINNLGLERFGIWSIAGSLITSLRSLDLGLGAGVTKFVAEAVGQNNLRRANLMFWSGAILSIFFVTIVSLLFFGSRSFLLERLLHVSHNIYEEANLAFALSAAALWSGAALKTVGRLLDGLQRMDMNNAVQTLSSIANVLGMWAVLKLDGGLPALIVVNLVTSTLAAVAIVIIARNYLPIFRLNLAELKIAEVWTILRYSIIVQVGSLATLILDPLMKIFIGSLLSTGFVGIYEAGQRAASVLRQLLAAGLAALLPASAGLKSIHSPSTRRLYFLISRFIGLIATPATLAIILFAPIFATLWVGFDLAFSVGWTIRGLAIAGWTGTMATIAFYIAQGTGHEKLSTTTLMINAISMALITPPAIVWWGYAGAISAYTFSVFLAWAYLTWTFNSLIGISTRELIWPSIVRPIVWNIPLFLISAWLIHTRHTNWGWPWLALAGAAYFSLALIVTVKTGDLRANEREWLRNSWHHLASRMFKLFRLIGIHLRSYYSYHE